MFPGFLKNFYLSRPKDWHSCEKSSLNRIETISNAMELRGFGKEKKRTWYVQRRLQRNDWLVIGFVLVILVVDLVVTFWDGSRFFNPFV